MNISKTLREIADKLETNKDPQFIDSKDIKTGMRLKSWFVSNYQPTHGKYCTRDGFITIRKTDGDLIYHSFNDSAGVGISLRCSFIEHTLVINHIDDTAEKVE